MPSKGAWPKWCYVSTHMMLIFLINKELLEINKGKKQFHMEENRQRVYKENYTEENQLSSKYMKTQKPHRGSE